MKYQAYYKGSKVKAPGWIFMSEKARQLTVWEQNVAWFDNNFEITDFETWEQNGEHMVTVRFTPLDATLADLMAQHQCIRVAFCRHLPTKAGGKTSKKAHRDIVPNELFNNPHTLDGGYNTLVNGGAVYHSNTGCQSLRRVSTEELQQGAISFSIEYLYTGYNYYGDDIQPSHKHSWSAVRPFEDVTFVDHWAIGLMGSDKGNYRIQTRFYTHPFDVLTDHNQLALTSGAAYVCPALLFKANQLARKEKIIWQIYKRQSN